MSAQTDNTSPAPQTKADKLVEVPNVDAYSTNFYFDMAVEGQTFSAQMTVRGGANGLDHIQRVQGAMKEIVSRGGAARTRIKGGEAAQPAQDNGNQQNGLDWGKNKQGRRVLFLNGTEPEPDSVPCPLHPGKTLKRKVNNDGSWLTHKDGDSFCNAGFAKKEAR